MGVLKHFVEECVGSIQLGGIKTFWSSRTFWLKIVHKESVKFKNLFELSYMTF